jgi:predicted extracellular nuclease
MDEREASPCGLKRMPPCNARRARGAKAAGFAAAVAILMAGVKASAAGVFISEYVEGAGNDKALEWDVFAAGDLSDLGEPGAACTDEEPPLEEPCGAPATSIHVIQGAGDASPSVGAVVSIEAVVTGDYQGATGLGGFFVQEEDVEADASPATSEGLFVFDGSGSVPVNAGDIVRVRGRVAEFSGLTELTAVEHVQVCAGGANVRAATLRLPVASPSELEALEGMAVALAQPMIVTDTFDQARFGEVELATERLLQPTQGFSPGAAALAAQGANDLRRIQLDDGSSVQNPVLTPHLGEGGTLRVGDRIRRLGGVLGFGFGSYEIHPTETVRSQRANRRELSPPDPGGRLRVASFNVLNYFTTLDDGEPLCGPSGGLECRGADNALELERQRTKIVRAIASLNADVIGLIELQNDASASIADLVAGVDELLGASTYAYVDTGTIGTDAIKVGLIYKPSAVEPLGDYAILDSSVDPSFIDTLSRPVLAQTFTELATGEVFTVAVNHLKSKGSACDAADDPDAGDGQGNCNLTRRAAASAEQQWLAGDPTGSGDPDVLLIGDFNAYALEDPIVLLTGSGYVNLIAKFVGDGAYSYVFDGQSGYLDHALSSSELMGQVTSAVEWHINADEPRFLDYNVEFNPPSAFQPDAFRSSDHDPLIVGLNLGQERGCGQRHPGR